MKKKQNWVKEILDLTCSFIEYSNERKHTALSSGGFQSSDKL